MNEDQIRQKFTDDVFTKFKEESIGAVAAPHQKNLYHYTTAEGIKGIFESAAIWATNYRYVNDLTEYKYANDILKTAIEERRTSASPLVHALFDAILSTPDLLLGAVDVFLACFCEEGDLLSQWRVYGGRGGGYAIGLQPALQEHPGVMNARQIGMNYSLYKVNYDEVKQRDIVKFILDNFCVAADQLGVGIDPASLKPPVIFPEISVVGLNLKSSIPEPLGNLCIRLSLAFVEMACTFKNPIFKVEQEWRLVNKKVQNDPQRETQVRVAGSSLIPYKKLPLWIFCDHREPRSQVNWNFVLKEVVLGPGMNYEATSQSLGYLTSRYSSIAGPIGIRPSVIKVRV